MKIKDLPSVIKKRAKKHIKKQFNCGFKPRLLEGAFDWGDTEEGLNYWILVHGGKFLDAENHLREQKGDDIKDELFEIEKERNKKRDRMIELIEDAHWNMESSDGKEFKGSAFFLDEALDVKVNEPEVVKPNHKLPWYLTTEDAPIFNSKVDAVKLGTNSVRIINDSFKKAIEMKRDRIVESVVEKFRSRSEVGIRKYGTTLADNNTDDFLIHLQEELMDAILYIEKLKSK